jgi:hypothetical protein
MFLGRKRNRYAASASVDVGSMEDDMISRRSTAGAALVATVCGIALQVQASADKVAFPENYAKGVKWLVVDKAETKQVHELYAMPEAIEAARKGQPMPNGTVFTVVRNSAQLDAQGKPDDPNGRWY